MKNQRRVGKKTPISSLKYKKLRQKLEILIRKTIKTLERTKSLNH